MAISTGNIGIDPAGDIQQYVPPAVTVTPPGSIVSYGAPQTLAQGEILPAGIWQVQAGQLSTQLIAGATVVPVSIKTALA